MVLAAVGQLAVQGEDVGPGVKTALPSGFLCGNTLSGLCLPADGFSDELQGRADALLGPCCHHVVSLPGKASV